MQEGGLRAQAYFHLKKVRPVFFIDVTPEMEGPDFYISDDDNNDNDDDKNNS